MTPPALSPRRRFALALTAASELGAMHSVDWLIGGPPGGGWEAFAHRMLVAEGLDHPQALLAELRWLESTGHRASGSTAAYDRTLLIGDVRFGAAVGWLDEATAWQWIDRQADALTTRYRGWQPFAIDYVEGREARWKRELARARSYLVETFENPRSLWNRIPWGGVTASRDHVDDLLPPLDGEHAPKLEGELELELDLDRRGPR